MTPKLIVTTLKAGTIVRPGDTITDFRDEPHVFVRADRANIKGHDGKITTRQGRRPGGEPGFEHSYYAGNFGLVVSTVVAEFTVMNDGITLHEMHFEKGGNVSIADLPRHNVPVTLHGNTRDRNGRTVHGTVQVEMSPEEAIEMGKKMVEVGEARLAEERNLVMAAKTKPVCQDVHAFLKAHCGKDALGVLTEQDYRALHTFAHLVKLYAVCSDDDLESVVRAMGLVLHTAQGSTWHLFNKTIPHGLDWSDENRLWQEVTENDPR